MQTKGLEPIPTRNTSRAAFVLLRLPITAIGVLTLFGLSTVAGSAELHPDSILYTRSLTFYEFSSNGELLQSFPIQPSGVVRDLAPDGIGNVHFFIGTFEPSLATFNLATETWSSRTFPGWSTVNNSSYGGLAAYATYVFVTDMLAGSGPQRGLIRFDINNPSASLRFSDGHDYIDVNIGLNERLYGVRQNQRTVDVFSPHTLELIDTINLTDGPFAVRVRGISANESGEMFGVTWSGRICRFDSSGLLEECIDLGLHNLGDINLAQNSNIVTATDTGLVFVTDEGLFSSASFDVPPGGLFVSWTEEPVPVELQSWSVE